jgi:hypothetical protein
MGGMDGQGCFPRSLSMILSISLQEAVFFVKEKMKKFQTFDSARKMCGLSMALANLT